jgi:hypothetical protein
MQIESIVPSVPNHFFSPPPAAVTQVTANGKAQTAIVEQTLSGYEAYVPNQPGPQATGPSVALAESRLYLNSTVAFQA